MSMKFLISRNGQQYGPYPSESLAEMLRKGQVVPADLMFVEGWSSWKSVADYLRTQVSSPPPIPIPPRMPTQQPPPPTAGGTAAAVPPLIGGTSEVEHAVLQGGRFVTFHYCFSVLIISFKRSSPVIFLRGEEDGFSDAFSNSLISLTAGWWVSRGDRFGQSHPSSGMRAAARM